MIGRRFTSSRIRKARQKRLLIQLVLWIILAGALLFLVVEIVYLKQTRIELVRFEGNKAIRKEELWEALKPYVEGEYAYLFSKKNIFIVPTDRIERKLKERFIRLEDIDLYREGLHTLVVTSVEREPVGIWCGTATTSECYYLDENGLAFGPAPNLLGTSFVTYEQKFPEEIIGAHVSYPEGFLALRNFMASLVPLGFQAYHAVFTDDRIDLTVRGTLPNGETMRLVLKIPLTPPYDTTFSNLTSVTRAAGTETPPLSITGLEYIDLRFEHKVFYKKMGTAEAEAPAPEQSPQ
jgi:hypothetical protein